jgi:opacity protein-like surface antigen
MSPKAVKKLVIMSLLLFSTTTLVPALATASEEAASSTPHWGLTLRGGVYGVPDWLLDLLFEEHPSVDGTMGGFELRYFGSGGPPGAFSVALTVDVGRTEGEGLWQEDAGDVPVVGGGEVNLAAATLTAYLDMMPSSRLHPYIGLGLGAGYAEGTYIRDGEEITVDEYVPVIHIPVGLILALGEHLALGIEGRVIDGISYGGFLQLRF